MSDCIYAQLVGYLCRWVVMLLCIAAAAVTLVMCLGALAELTDAPSTRLVVPDRIVGPGRSHFAVSAYLSPDTRLCSCASLAGRMDQRGGFLFYPYRREHIVSLPVSPGFHEVQVVGLPYSPAGLDRAHARVFVTSPSQTLYLMDDQTLLHAVRGERGALGEALAAMRTRGLAAAFVPGPLDRYLAIYDALQAAGLGYLPVVTPRGRVYDLAHTFDRVTRGLNGVPAQSRTWLVTSDPNLAGHFARFGWPAHLVGGEPQPGPGSENVVVHESMAALARDLK